MTLTTQQEQMAERLAYLIANSTMDEKLKKMIIDKLESLPDTRIAFLLQSLEEEHRLAGTLDATLEKFAVEQEEAQKKLATKQKTVATKLVNEAVKDIKLKAARDEVPV